MPKTKVVTYGIGGYKPDVDDNNVVEEYEVDVAERVETEDQKKIAELEERLAALETKAPSK